MNNLQNVFAKVMVDLKEFLPNLTLVGGWVPYVYKNFVWKDVIIDPHYTMDVDFGIDKKGALSATKTIYNTIAALKYPERHIKVGKLSPVVPLVKVSEDMNPVPLEFICDDKLHLKTAQRLTGGQIRVDQIRYFNILLSETCTVPIKCKGIVLKVKLPTESIFIFHKLATFYTRGNKTKMAKDLYYAYYMLRFSPNTEDLRASFTRYKGRKDWKLVRHGAERYFMDTSSEGVIMTESEFGPDSIVTDLRGHILEVFKNIL